jgi:hypothetical protein
MERLATSASADDERAKHVCEPDEVVPGALRARLRWDWQHDAAVAEVMREYGLSLPRDREAHSAIGGSRGLRGASPSGSDGLERTVEERNPCAGYIPSSAPILGFLRAQARARQQFRAVAHEWEAELALVQADLADIAIEYRQQLDVELAVIERAASPDMLLH